MDYKYIEQLLERYFDAETTLEEESILRTFFSQKDVPAALEQWRPLFMADDSLQLGDDFDARIMGMIGVPAEGSEQASARVVTLKQRLMPLFRAAAVVAIVVTVGGALQAPWDSSWQTPSTYASYQQDADTVVAVKPIQAENVSDIAADSSKVMLQGHTKD